MASHAIFEVWSVVSGSILMAYPTEDEALCLVRAQREAYGDDATQQLMIVRERRGRSKILWQGDALIKRVLGEESGVAKAVG